MHFSSGISLGFKIHSQDRNLAILLAVKPMGNFKFEKAVSKLEGQGVYFLMTYHVMYSDSAETVKLFRSWWSEGSDKYQQAFNLFSSYYK